ncbi:MAG: hypothetical protein ACTSRS_02330 [Candidatus Helarchaeota archaeon]
MVKELGVAYHGNVYLDHARADFREMQEHGCNSILLAMSEYDYDQWRGQYYKMAKMAKEEFDFTVYINLWAWGRVFGGEAPSLFLSNNHQYRQIFSKNSKPFPAVCFNAKPFLNYIKKAIKNIARVEAIDGFFWDEPHYAYSRENLLPTDLSPYYVCYCPFCQKLFQERFGSPMPKTQTPEIMAFKEVCLRAFLQKLCQFVKKVAPTKRNTICVMPSIANTGLSDWKSLCFAEMDTLATDPYWIVYGQDLHWVRTESENLIRIARQNQKQSQLWVLGFAIPKGREFEIQQVIKIFEDLKVDSIFAWLYRGGLQTLIKSYNPALVWETIGMAFKQIPRKL